MTQPNELTAEEKAVIALKYYGYNDSPNPDILVATGPVLFGQPIIRKSIASLTILEWSAQISVWAKLIMEWCKAVQMAGGATELWRPLFELDGKYNDALRTNNPASALDTLVEGILELQKLKS